MQASLKTSFAQISRAAQKIWVAPNFFFGRGGAVPSHPPARTPMCFAIREVKKIVGYTEDFVNWGSTVDGAWEFGFMDPLGIQLGTARY